MKNGAVFLGCTLLLLIWNCSTKKDTFLNRTGHAMSTKYNVLFNGNIAFEEAKEQLDASYEDNFWERLPIEPLEIEEDRIPLPGQQLPDEGEATGFEKAEEKAVKSVQKHSMVIDGYERNSQIPNGRRVAVYTRNRPSSEFVNPIRNNRKNRGTIRMIGGIM